MKLFYRKWCSCQAWTKETGINVTHVGCHRPQSSFMTIGIMREGNKSFIFCYYRVITMWRLSLKRVWLTNTDWIQSKPDIRLKPGDQDQSGVQSDTTLTDLKRIRAKMLCIFTSFISFFFPCYDQLFTSFSVCCCEASEPVKSCFMTLDPSRATVHSRPNENHMMFLLFSSVRTKKKSNQHNTIRSLGCIYLFIPK